MFRIPNGTANHSATAGTIVRVACGGEFADAITVLAGFSWKAAGTAHTGTAMKSASRSTVTDAVAAAGTEVTSAAQLTDGAGNNIASGDTIAVQLSDGTWHTTTVNGAPSGLTLTMADAVPAGKSIAAGAAIACYGVAGDAMHAKHRFALYASATTSVPRAGVAVRAGSYVGEPIVLEIDNATAAGLLEEASWVYTPRQ